MRKRNAVSKSVRERICKLPWRHQDTRFNVVRLGHQVPPYIHGHLSNTNKCDAESLRLITVLPRLQGSRQAKAKWRQVTKTRSPPPSISKRHHGTVFTIGASHQEGSPSPHKVSLPLHTKSECHTTSTRLLAAARLLSRELSQELIPITSTKHSHKCA